jgi:Ca2+-binding RTX toxin-like protein
LASGDDTIITGGGDNLNSRDTYYGNGSGDDTIVASDGNYNNVGNGGDDYIVAGEGDDTLTEDSDADVFSYGEDEDTITITDSDYNPDEGDVKAADCENF